MNKQMCHINRILLKSLSVMYAKQKLDVYEDLRGCQRVGKEMLMCSLTFLILGFLNLLWSLVSGQFILIMLSIDFRKFFWFFMYH